MPTDLIPYTLTSFVTLLVVVDPFVLPPICEALTRNLTQQERRATMNRAVLIALGVALFFLSVGRLTLSYLGVSMHAFSISGGILMFAVAFPMLFGNRPGLQGGGDEAGSGEDVSIFPLAIPLLSGPGAITTILLLTSQARGNGWLLGALTGVIFVVFAITWFILRIGGWVTARIGKSGAAVVTRLMGIILASLAIQFVLNGVTGYWHLLEGH